MKTLIRCAIYTRCPDEDVQYARQEGEAYVRQHATEGWVALVKRYDDPGASGRSLLRPGLAILLRDIAGHRVDCVVVLDAARLTRDSAVFLSMCNYSANYGVKLAFYAESAEPAGENP